MHRQVCFSLLWITAPFPWVLVHTEFLCVLQGGVCFPQSCGVPELKPHCPLKPNTLEAHSSLCKTPRLGNLTWAPELSFLWENFYGINCSLVCGLLIPGSGYGI